jgi:hypothetical protein
LRVWNTQPLEASLSTASISFRIVVRASSEYRCAPALGAGALEGWPLTGLPPSLPTSLLAVVVVVAACAEEEDG